MTTVETVDSFETGMNPVTMTIINPRKEYWLSRVSNQQSSKTLVEWCMTLKLTILIFNTDEKESCWKTLCENEKTAGNQHSNHFHKIFYTHP